MLFSQPDESLDPTYRGSTVTLIQGNINTISNVVQWVRLINIIPLRAVKFYDIKRDIPITGQFNSIYRVGLLISIDNKRENILTDMLLGAVQTLRNASKGVGVAKCDSPILFVLRNGKKA